LNRAVVADPKLLSEAFRLKSLECQRLSSSTHAENLLVAPAGSRLHCLRTWIISINDRRPARWEQNFEQPQLGGEVILDIRVIIEMVAPEVCEGSCCDPHAVDTALIEPV